MSKHTIWVCLVSLGFCACGEKAPPFRPEMREVSTPQALKLPYYRGEIMDPWWSDKKELPANLRKLDDFSLIDQSGQPLARQSLADKYTIVGFFFARCSGICPMVTSQVKKLSEKIPNQRDLVFLSMSVDPESDNPEVLSNYKARFTATQKNWYFLTGKKDTIYDLARKTFNADVVTPSRTDGSANFLHTENIYLLDKQAYLRGIYRTRGGVDIGRLMNDLELLRKNG